MCCFDPGRRYSFELVHSKREWDKYTRTNKRSLVCFLTSSPRLVLFYSSPPPKSSSSTCIAELPCSSGAYSYEGYWVLSKSFKRTKKHGNERLLLRLVASEACTIDNTLLLLLSIYILRPDWGSSWNLLCALSFQFLHGTNH